MTDRHLSPSSTSSTLSNITVQTDKQPDARAMSSASPSISTPPTSLGDEASVLSEATKVEHAVEVYVEAPAPPQPSETAASAQITTPAPANTEGRRPARSSRKSVTTYNVQILAGTAIHTPTKYLEKHHKNVVHGSLENLIDKDHGLPPKKKIRKPKPETTDASDQIEQQLAVEAAQAARRRTSSRVTDLRKELLRNISGVTDAGVNIVAEGKALLHGTLRRSTSEPHLKSGQSASASLKRSRAAMEDGGDSENSKSEDKIFARPKSKVWLKQGLYVGQDRDFDPRLSESQNRAKKRTKKPREDNVLPLPIFACERLLNEDPRHVFRDFKLPFDTYSPLPRKVKVDGWVKLNKNRFIGDASALWKRDKQDSSQCYCDVEDGCGEACHNRIMAYECDNTNCPLPPEQCNNRPFAELKRRSKGNRYDYGVEVLDTEDRGYGVRAMRTFEPHQIIVEYAGEIITQSECERRMKQVYKKDKCYYLMSFDNKMIIDATRGTIARFVNHSCEPNCEMIKWTVGGEPRMALFAGPRGIMTGEELTYDYNFDPFSQKNIQECRCGTESCRGVLGPKPKKPVEDKSVASNFITGTKRKLQDLLGAKRSGSESSHGSPKKRKMFGETSAMVKARNALMRSESARDRAEREANELSRQNASRENRALKRSTSANTVKHARPAKSRAAQSTTVRHTRHTKVSFQHRTSRPGALKVVKKSSGATSAPQRTDSKLSNRKGLRSLQRPSTPMQETGTDISDSEEDASPNITPASLRSASRKSTQLSPMMTHYPAKSKTRNVQGNRLT
ncbi:protein containing SET domain [Pyrenophora tritici-repentis]|uniref:Protein containing SET domain protein n=1 Tax=Pyrenophora tritici-repentis TaxID=45151 RepID=A0A2W1ES04_9PLEO|nr:protein containing SET domain protein [Pyrenophora tritici-repentis]KAF7444757.1 protein containing SET domain protein [Pyrenophora tritici-repentis]KAF7564582.1 protein containing SET domain protein [Pyrenophora tritici-repentis]KAG9378997.1 protein containing SET domain protein [Pyrenophora tritici-repentis]KAI0573393.1 protein containing SET domain protein [Pyrenophora tritici-repentis]